MSLAYWKFPQEDHRTAVKRFTFLTDVYVEQTGSAETDSATASSPAEIRVSYLPNREPEERFILTHDSETGRSKTTGTIEVPWGASEIRMVLVDVNGQDVGRVQFPRGNMIGLEERGSIQALSEGNHTDMTIPVLGSSGRLTLHWKVKAGSQDHISVGLLVSEASSLWTYWKGTGNLSDLDKVISLEQTIVELTSGDHPDFPKRLGNLGSSWSSRFEITSEQDDIDQAISLERKAVDFTPEDAPHLPERLARLASSLSSRFDLTEDQEDLELIVSLERKVLDLTPETDPHLLPLRLGNLGISLLNRFEHTGAPEDLHEAISLEEKALDITPEGHPDMALRLGNLGLSVFRRFEHAGVRGDLERAISTMKRSVELTPEGDSDLPQRLCNLGVSLSKRFEETGRLADLKEAISLERKALTLTPEYDVDRPARLCNIGISFLTLFERTGDLDQLEQAIVLQQEAVDLTPGRHPDLPRRLSSLGNSLSSRFERTGDPEDLEQDVELQKRAVELTPARHQDLPIRLSDLGTSFTMQYEHTGDLGDLEQAILAEKKAVELTPEGHPELPRRLGHLGSSLSRRFSHAGDLDDLEQAISLKQRAIKLTPNGHPFLVDRLGNLGGSYYSRYKHTGERADLEQAVSLKERAVELTPEGHPDMALRLSGLGIVLFRLFELTEAPSVLERAILTLERAVAETPEGHQEMPSRVSNLGTLFSTRFDSTGRPDDVEKAIMLHRKALKLTPKRHPSMRFRASHLGRSYYSRFDRGAGDSDDLDQAILLLQRAVKLTPEDDTSLPPTLFDLGSAFRSRYLTEDGDPDDLESAIQYFKASAMCPTGSLIGILNAATRWALEAHRHDQDSPEITQALECASLILAKFVAGVQSTLHSRYSQIAWSPGVALDAASAALAVGQGATALEWLELGRCLVWNQLTNLRTPLEELRAHDTSLAQKLSRIASQFEALASLRRSPHAEGSLSDEMVEAEKGSRRHLELAKEWEAAIASARGIPGFEKFLLPPRYTDIVQHLPASGYVVVINVAKERCDALALSRGMSGPLHVPLPAFSQAKARAYRSALKASFDQHNIRMRQEGTTDNGLERGARLARRETPSMVKLLRGLWTDLVEPIFKALKLEMLDGCSHAELPRIWWCPTGVLSFLPIHAAGVYDCPGESVCVLDYAVSSYTPTVTALTSRVKQGHALSKGISGLFLTNQPHPPHVSAPPIPGTTAEVRAIHAKVVEAEGPIRVLKLEGNEVTVRACLEHMEQISNVHLACHASQNAADPLASRFLFHDGTLDLDTIIKQDLRNADMAFLSACQTSVGEEKLPDEAVHLAAGMLAAGYRRVIATMWSIRDEYAPQVAGDFYQYLLDHRESEEIGGGFDGGLSAEALHFAIQGLRVRLDRVFGGDVDSALLTWVPYVHFGY